MEARTKLAVENLQSFSHPDPTRVLLSLKRNWLPVLSAKSAELSNHCLGVS